MAGKFNTDFLTGKTAAKEITDKFKNTQDIFNKASSIVDILPLDKLVAYSQHPFKVREGERLAELIDSIKEQGILVPLIVRIHPTQVGQYEILAGHHRYTAAERAGLAELPCIIKNADDNMAALIVVESNKQRGFSDMLPSEIAKALKLEYDALKCQGKRTDLFAELDEIMQEENSYKCSEGNENSTCFPLENKLKSEDKLALNNNISSATLHRYIRLNFLTPPLLDMVDNNEFAIRPAVDLSYLSVIEQEMVFASLNSGYKVDMKKAEKLKEYSQASRLNEDTIKLILSGTIFEVKPKKVTSLKLSMKKVQEYLPADIPQAQVEPFILQALEYYSQNKPQSE